MASKHSSDETAPDQKEPTFDGAPVRTVDENRMAGRQVIAVGHLRPTDHTQPDPVHNELPAAWDLVLADIEKRDKFGEAKYGTRLQPHNGRDTLRDVYEEALDMVVYLRTLIYERDNK